MEDAAELARGPGPGGPGVAPTSDLLTGEHLGRRVAELAVVIARGRALTPAVA
ncbi:MAG: hypothetical protein H0V73_12955 [Chloroflexi bacterium]|nr:hypothetical protein [Chloroflexota bacterium]